MPEIDLFSQYKNDVFKLIIKCNPVGNTIEYPIQLKLIPKHHFINFNESPTRLSAAERDVHIYVVKSQVDEWLKFGIVHEKKNKVVLEKKRGKLSCLH